MTDLMDRPLVPVANPDDAVETYARIADHLDTDSKPVVVNVVEKAGGAIDKAGVEQREEVATEAFDAFRTRAAADGVSVETEILYATDVAEGINDHADEVDATAIAFASRGGGRLLDLLSGSVRTKLTTESRFPVVVLPEE